MLPPLNSFGEMRERTRSRDHIVQELVPSSGWTEDSNAHHLLVGLPGYKKAEIRLQVDRSGQITVGGERLVHPDKYEYFEQTYQAPENSEMDKITGQFDGEILCVTIPKKAVEDEEEEKEEEEGEAGEEGEEEEEEEGEEACPANKERGDEDDYHNTKFKDLMSNKTDSSVDGLHNNHKEFLRKRGRNALLLMEMLKRNKGMLLTAVVAFSLGLMVTWKFRSTWYY